MVTINRRQIEAEAIQQFVQHAADTLVNTSVSRGRREYIATFLRVCIVEWNRKQREAA